MDWALNNLKKLIWHITQTNKQINFLQILAKLKDHKILLLEPVLTNMAVKSANLTSEKKRLIKAPIGELTLSIIY